MLRAFITEIVYLFSYEKGMIQVKGKRGHNTLGKVSLNLCPRHDLALAERGIFLDTNYLQCIEAVFFVHS